MRESVPLYYGKTLGSLRLGSKLQRKEGEKSRGKRVYPKLASSRDRLEGYPTLTKGFGSAHYDVGTNHRRTDLRQSADSWCGVLFDLKRCRRGRQVSLSPGLRTDPTGHNTVQILGIFVFCRIITSFLLCSGNRTENSRRSSNRPPGRLWLGNTTARGRPLSVLQSFVSRTGQSRGRGLSLPDEGPYPNRQRTDMYCPSGTLVVGRRPHPSLPSPLRPRLLCVKGPCFHTDKSVSTIFEVVDPDARGPTEVFM